ncbi:hypothetical protein PtA15_7A1 [Puccinia triticina]|uniref:Uncharacterized protein n=1 Tax=Puccinia triticina TaxID=208348 RepID=A0ABY7CMG9_9BASI|nr:uncharacterized protein PtA15_7A1 [Puccinia triticina]WAQ86275.1 hypothetical protein PtA15_7A1 [Puccinia triticina]
MSQIAKLLNLAGPKLPKDDEDEEELNASEKALDDSGSEDGIDCSLNGPGT